MKCSGCGRELCSECKILAVFRTFGAIECVLAPVARIANVDQAIALVGSELCLNRWLKKWAITNARRHMVN